MTQRTEKVQSLIKQTVAQALQEEVSAAVVGVTGVDVSPDLKHATVWYDVTESNDKKRQQIIESVTAAKPKLQATVAKIMTTKYVPKLELKLDTGADYAEHINEIIREL